MTVCGIIIAECEQPRLYTHEQYIIMVQDHYYYDQMGLLKAIKNKCADLNDISSIQVVFVALRDKNNKPKFPFFCAN